MVGLGGLRQDRAGVRIKGFDDTWGHAEVTIETDGETEDRPINFIMSGDMTAVQMQIAALEAALDELEAMAEVVRIEIGNRKSGG